LVYMEENCIYVYVHIWGLIAIMTVMCERMGFTSMKLSCHNAERGER